MYLELFLFVVFLFLFFFYGRMLYGRFTLPPGPIPLPIFGNILQLDEKRPHYTIRQWSKQYGPVFTMWLANMPVVIVTDYEIMKEACTGHGDQLSGRHRTFALDAFTHGNHGILLADGETWREQRRFGLQTLRNYGMGRDVMDEKILTEARHLSDTIKEDMKFQHEAVLDLHHETMRCIGNVITSMIFGIRFPRGDPRFAHFQRTIEGDFNFNTLLMHMVNSWPWLRHVPLFGHFGTDELNRQEENFRQFLIGHIQSRKEELKDKTLDKDDEPLAFVEAFLKEMNRRKKAGEDMSSFTEWQLVAITLDFIGAGTETLVATFQWLYLAMIKFPHVQRRVFKEIDDVIGRRSPSTADRQSMPYVMATLNEIQRWRYILPFNFVRTNETDFELGGYKLPKSAHVITQISAQAINEKVFPHPEEFNPERFLEEDGKSLKKVIQFVPFSLGRRNCLGEGLARAELFLIFVHMMQNFELALVPGTPEPSDEPLPGIPAGPDPFKVVVKLRHEKA